MFQYLFYKCSDDIKRSLLAAVLYLCD